MGNNNFLRHASEHIYAVDSQTSLSFARSVFLTFGKHLWKWWRWWQEFLLISLIMSILHLTAHREGVFKHKDLSSTSRGNVGDRRLTPIPLSSEQKAPLENMQWYHSLQPNESLARGSAQKFLQTHCCVTLTLLISPSYNLPHRNENLCFLLACLLLDVTCLLTTSLFIKFMIVLKAFAMGIFKWRQLFQNLSGKYFYCCSHWHHHYCKQYHSRFQKEFSVSLHLEQNLYGLPKVMVKTCF